jgi:hypothetical protein
MRPAVLALAAGFIAFAPAVVVAQDAALPRLPSDLLDVVPPSSWVQGTPGRMTIRRGECRELPSHQLRRRIVDIAVQEWAFFGFPVLDLRNGARLSPPGALSGSDQLAPQWSLGPGRTPPLGPGESARVAATIAGYWAVTPQGPGIVSEQNRNWNGPNGVAARWRAPWSAAFISWVMCEAGLGNPDAFQHAIAHWTYVDQAIRARDGRSPQAAFVAYDIGEAAVEPGDMLCQSNRPAYRSLAERRRQLGGGARSHCDVVVEVDEGREQILTIGGNVLRVVRLKIFPALRDPEGKLRPESGEGRPLYAHLKLRADPIEAGAIRSSATFQAPGCSNGTAPQLRMVRALSELGIEVPVSDGCR